MPRLNRLRAPAAFALVILSTSMTVQAKCTEVNVTGVAPDYTASQSGPQIFATNWVAQVFTAPGTGCIGVREITFRLRKFGNPGNLMIEIYGNVDGDKPPVPVGLGGSAKPLGSTSLAAAVVASAGYLDRTASFGDEVELTAGSKYALIAYQKGGAISDHYRLGLARETPYTGGQYCRWTGAAWDCSSNTDVRLAFCNVSCASTGERAAP